MSKNILSVICRAGQCSLYKGNGCCPFINLKNSVSSNNATKETVTEICEEWLIYFLLTVLLISAPLMLDSSFYNAEYKSKKAGIKTQAHQQTACTVKAPFIYDRALCEYYTLKLPFSLKCSANYSLSFTAPSATSKKQFSCRDYLLSRCTILKIVPFIWNTAENKHLLYQCSQTFLVFSLKQKALNALLIILYTGTFWMPYKGIETWMK